MEDQRMPDEVLELFFAHLDLKSLARACGVCFRWKGIIYSNNNLWQQHINPRLRHRGVLSLPNLSQLHATPQSLNDLRTREGNDNASHRPGLSLRGNGVAENSDPRGLMKQLCSSRRGCEEEILIVVEGGKELRHSFKEALVWTLRNELQDGNEERNSSSEKPAEEEEREEEDIRAFNQGLMYRLQFGDANSWEAHWMRTGSSPFFLSEYIVVYVFSLDGEGAGGLESLWAMERAHLLMHAVDKKEEVPVVLLGLKDVRGESARGPPFLIWDLSSTPQQEQQPQQHEQEEVEHLLERNEDDIEEGNGEDGESASISPGEDGVRKEAIQYARQRMRCECYIETGWNPPSPPASPEENVRGVGVVVEPLALLAALLEVRRRVKENVAPASFHSSRTRLQQRQHGSSLFSVCHVLEALFSLILLPIPGLVSAAVTIGTAFWMIGELTLRVFQSTSIDTHAKPLLCLMAIFPLFFWALLFASRSLVIALVSPFFFFISGFYVGYHYGFGESARHAWLDGWKRSKRDNKRSRDLVEKMVAEGATLEVFLLPQNVLPYIFLALGLFAALVQWWMSQPTTIHPLQPWI